MSKARQLIGSLGEYDVETANLMVAEVQASVWKGGRWQRVDASHSAIRRAVEVVRPESPRRIVYPSRVRYGGRWYSAPVCNRPSCAMCAVIRRKLSTPIETREGQEPSSSSMIDEALNELRMDETSVFADLGCGDGRVLIAAAERTGCRAIGVEIDAGLWAKAHRAVQDAGLADRVRVLRGDAKFFDPQRHKVTHAYAYLMPDTLEKLRPVLDRIPKVFAPHRP